MSQDQLAQSQKPTLSADWLQRIALMESYTVIDTLHQHPELRKHAVVITDHAFPLLFFQLEHVERVQMGNETDNLTGSTENAGYTEAPYPYYDPAIHSQQIKLIEIASPLTMDSLCNVTSSINANEVTLDLNNVLPNASTTFVYLRLPSDPHVAEPCFMFQEFLKRSNAGYHFHTGCQLYFPEKYSASLIQKWSKTGGPLTDVHLYPNGPGPLLSPYTFNSLTENLAISSSLTTLHIEGIRNVSHLRFEYLKDLSVVFRTEPNDMSRPSIKNIRVPFLEYFVIHYDGIVPNIQDIGIVECVKFRENSPAKFYSTFELANINCIEGNPSPKSGQSQSYRNSQADTYAVNLSFLGPCCYSTVSLIGVPHFILHDKADLRTVELLYIQLTANEEINHPPEYCACGPLFKPVDMKRIVIYDPYDNLTETTCPLLTDFANFVGPHEN